MKKIILVIIIAVVVWAASYAGYYFLLLPHFNQSSVATTAADQLFGWKFPNTIKFPSTGGSGDVAYSSIRDPGGIPQGLPVRLQIPVISVDSAVEDALITSDGRMDVPAGAVDVAWFALGPQPGQVGSAVIGGHFGISNGVPWVFYNLDKLKIGDKVYVIDDQGNTITFQVRDIKSFDRNADATTVFTSQDGLAHLNLITCEGIWNQVNGTYPQRLVIFTDQIPTVGAVPAAASTPTTSANPFSRTLSIGSKGIDVVALQTILEQKGFLKMPTGVAKGLFGALTRTAVAKYQTSLGLSSTGSVGPLTRAKLAVAFGNSPALPTTGTENGAAPGLISQTVIDSSESLFATPIDGLITSLLLILIIFFGFKMVRGFRK